jgi:thiamine pyrophosphokinase
MTLTKAISIGLAALLAVPAVAAGDFDSCTPVSFDTLKTTTVKDKEP